MIVALFTTANKADTVAGYIISPHDEWRVKVVGYQLVGYFNVKKDDVELIDENNDGAYERAIINGTFTLRDPSFAPPSYGDYETKTWSNWTSLNGSLYLAVFVVDSDGNEVAWLIPAYVRNQQRCSLASYSVEEHGILTVVTPDGSDLGIAIDSNIFGSELCGKWPTIIIKGPSRYEVCGIGINRT